jgi:hypothetical protein
MTTIEGEMKMHMDRLAALPPLAQGAHGFDDGNACLLEAVSYIAGEPWSDHPECACAVIAEFGREINDSMPDSLRDTLLRPLVLMIVGTRGSHEVQLRRAYIAADYAVREATPFALRAAAMLADADKLAALPEIVDAKTARDAFAAARAVGCSESHLAAYAAYAAAVKTAAKAAAETAVYAAVAAEATDANPTDLIWRGAAECLRRMCEVR